MASANGPDGPPVLGGAMRMTDLSTVVLAVSERIYAEFGQLLQILPSQPDQTRCEGRALQQQQHARHHARGRSTHARSGLQEANAA